MSDMRAVFLMSKDQLMGILHGTAIHVSLEPISNGAICAATGSAHSVMRLIGRLADHGEDTLYSANLEQTK